MRLGKRSKRSSQKTWPKAGDVVTPKYVSKNSVVGQVTGDLMAFVYAPQLLDIANRVLEHYVSELTDWQDALKLLEQQQQEQQDDDDDDGDGNKLGKAQIMVDGSIQYTTTTTTTTEAMASSSSSSSSNNNNNQTTTLTWKEPRVPVFSSQYRIREWQETLEDVSDFFYGPEATWRMAARAARFERLMEERYGIFLPFVKAHPELEQGLRAVQLKWQQGYFSPWRATPPIPRSTAVMVLFMLHRGGGVSWQVTLLATLFLLVGLQPWALVACVVLVHVLVQRRQQKPVGGMSTKIPRVPLYYAKATTKAEKHALLQQPIGTPFHATNDDDDLPKGSDYDAIVIGNDIPTLFTAALLTRAGRRVLVLCPGPDASGCETFTPELVSNNNSSSLSLLSPTLASRILDLPLDVQESNIGKISKQQGVLSAALCTDADAQGGIRFAQIGTAADDYCFEILDIPGLGTESLTDSLPWPVTAHAERQLPQDAAERLGDGWPASDGGVGASASAAYLRACQQLNASAALFYLSKLLPNSVNAFRSKSSYGECAVRYVQTLLTKSFPLHPHVRSLMAGMGMKYEHLRPKHTSLAPHITHVSAAVSGEGMHYPVGGPRALAAALAHVITAGGGGGGKVYTLAPVSELLLDESQLGKTAAHTVTSANNKQDVLPDCPRCVGVKLASGHEIRFPSSSSSSEKKGIHPVVVTQQGFLHTFIHLMPERIRQQYKVPRGLPALSEARPVFHICLALKGTPSDLNVTGADYYRLPGAARATDEWDAATNQARFGDIGWPDDYDSSTAQAEEERRSKHSKNNNHDNDDQAEGDDKPLVETVNEDTETAESHKVVKKARTCHYRVGESWMRISFPSAKDPTFCERHGDLTTCVITIEADDDFVQAFDTKPNLFVPKGTAKDRTKLGRLMESVQKDLLSIYPQLEGKILHAEVKGPVHRGLSHTPERFAATGLRPETQYPGLFCGGSDLTVGGSFAASIVAGWLTVNAVVGYSYIDLLFLGKNITTDIARFMEQPDGLDDENEDVAVPYTPPPPPRPPSVGTDASVDHGTEDM